MNREQEGASILGTIALFFYFLWGFIKDCIKFLYHIIKEVITLVIDKIMPILYNIDNRILLVILFSLITFWLFYRLAFVKTYNYSYKKVNYDNTETDS